MVCLDLSNQNLTEMPVIPGGVKYDTTPQIYLAENLDDMVNYAMLPNENDMFVKRKLT
jgi:hypothetical protein